MLLPTLQRPQPEGHELLCFSKSLRVLTSSDDFQSPEHWVFLHRLR